MVASGMAQGQQVVSVPLALPEMRIAVERLIGAARARHRNVERGGDGEARRDDGGQPMNNAIQGGAPVEGFYKTRRTNSGMWVAVRIWFGSPVIGGETQDRSPRWCVEVDGRTD